MKHLILISLSLLLFSCNEKESKTAEQLYREHPYMPDSEEKAIQIINNVLHNHQYIALEALTNPLHDSSFLLSKFTDASIKLIPKQKDGSFGVFNKYGYNSYYMQVNDFGVPSDTLVFMFEKTACCGYKIINIADVKSK